MRALDGKESSHLKGESLQIIVNNRELKEVDHFKYLGSVLTRDGYCTR